VNSKVVLWRVWQGIVASPNHGESDMQTATFEQAQQVVDQLSIRDQARLLEYLTPRVVDTVVAIKQAEAIESEFLPQAWQELFRIGDSIAALEASDQETLTETVVSMRR
jgi:hypothetical protein